MNKLTFFFAGLLLIPFIFDEVYAQTLTIDIFTSNDGYGADVDNDGTCNSTFGNVGLNFAGEDSRIGTTDSAQTTDCYRTWYEYDLSVLDEDVTITSVRIFMDKNLDVGLATCTAREMSNRPSDYIAAVDHLGLWNDMGNDTIYINNYVSCISASPIIEDLGAAAVTDLQAALTRGWFAIGMTAGSETQSGVNEWTSYFTRESSPSSQHPFIRVDYTPSIPDGVTDLTIINLATTTLDLTWTTPQSLLNGGTLLGSQINFTTPFGQPLTVVTNDTESTTNAVTVSGLAQATPFSFRVSVWTEAGNNATGNIANATTLQFGNFTVGAIDLEATNLDFRTWIFERTDLNSSAYELSVIYPSTFNATCQFHFKFANIDLNHSNLVTTSLPGSQVEATFVFNNTANEVIDVVCIDEADSTNAEGRFLLTQTNFILLQQFDQFRDGTFGTMGMFGAIDLITLFGIVFATIGFNRINESVGGFFMLVILGVMAFFQIIVWPTALSGAIAVVVMLVVMSTRKV